SRRRGPAPRANRRSGGGGRSPAARRARRGEFPEVRRRPRLLHRPAAARALRLQGRAARGRAPDARPAVLPGERRLRRLRAERRREARWLTVSRRLIVRLPKEQVAYHRSQGISIRVSPLIAVRLVASASIGPSLSRCAIARSIAFVTPRVGAREGPSPWLEAA